MWGWYSQAFIVWDEINLVNMYWHCEERWGVEQPDEGDDLDLEDRRHSELKRESPRKQSKIHKTRIKSKQTENIPTGNMTMDGNLLVINSMSIVELNITKVEPIVLLVAVFVDHDRKLMQSKRKSTPSRRSQNKQRIIPLWFDHEAWINRSCQQHHRTWNIHTHAYQRETGKVLYWLWCHCECITTQICRQERCSAHKMSVTDVEQNWTLTSRDLSRDNMQPKKLQKVLSRVHCC